MSALADHGASGSSGIFARLAEVQRQIRNPLLFAAEVRGDDIVISARNPGGPWALLDAVGAVFGESDLVDGCGSCGLDSCVSVRKVAP